MDKVAGRSRTVQGTKAPQPQAVREALAEFERLQECGLLAGLNWRERAGLLFELLDRIERRDDAELKLTGDGIGGGRCILSSDGLEGR